jgi:hypothetical protein
VIGPLFLWEVYRPVGVFFIPLFGGEMCMPDYLGIYTPLDVPSSGVPALLRLCAAQRDFGFVS